MIRTLAVDSGDFPYYRGYLKNKGFISATYFSVNGYNLKKMQALARQGKLNAIRCRIGQCVKWYYAEEQAEMAYLRGEVR